MQGRLKTIPSVFVFDIVKLLSLLFRHTFLGTRPSPSPGDRLANKIWSSGGRKRECPKEITFRGKTGGDVIKTLPVFGGQRVWAQEGLKGGDCLFLVSPRHELDIVSDGNSFVVLPSLPSTASPPSWTPPPASCPKSPPRKKTKLRRPSRWPSSCRPSRRA